MRREETFVSDRSIDWKGKEKCWWLDRWVDRNARVVRCGVQACEMDDGEWPPFTHVSVDAEGEGEGGLILTSQVCLSFSTAISDAPRDDTLSQRAELHLAKTTSGAVRADVFVYRMTHLHPA